MLVHGSSIGGVPQERLELLLAGREVPLLRTVAHFFVVHRPVEVRGGTGSTIVAEGELSLPGDPRARDVLKLPVRSWGIDPLIGGDQKLLLIRLGVLVIICRVAA